MKRRGELCKGSEIWAVQVTPEQHRYHTGNGIGEKKTKPEQRTQPRHTAVEEKCEDQGEAKHHRHLNYHEQQHAPNTFPETAILECLEVVLTTYENRTSNKPVGKEADSQCVSERKDEKKNEQEEKGSQKEIRQHHALAPAIPAQEDALLRHI